jgi:hypothetical protein
MPAEAGLIGVVGCGAGTGWTDVVLGPFGDGVLVWAAAGTHLERQALATVGLPGVRGVVLVGVPGLSGRAVRVALEWAVLVAGRRGSGGCVTSVTRPVAPEGVVRVPHLVSVRLAGAVVDVVVWELMPVAYVPVWLGAPMPEQGFFEARLGGLLRLRAAARAGRLPATAAGMRLARLLGGRGLSIRLVYQRPVLFRALLAGVDEQPDHPLWRRVG